MTLKVHCILKLDVNISEETVKLEDKLEECKATNQNNESEDKSSKVIKEETEEKLEIETNQQVELFEEKILKKPIEQHLELETKVITLNITSQQKAKTIVPLSVDETVNKTLDRIQSTLTNLFRQLGEFRRSITPQETQIGQLSRQVKKIQVEVKQMVNPSYQERVNLLEQNNVCSNINHRVN